jgi:hypothetical protein
MSLGSRVVRIASRRVRIPRTHEGEGGEGQIWGENNGGEADDRERFGLIRGGEDNRDLQNGQVF